jgi:mRNA interferase MazF
VEILSIGQVVLARFPFSDLSNQKLRPCVVIGLAEFDDILLCQITSKPYGSKRAISLATKDMQSGSIVVDSYIRPDKIATLDQKMLTKNLGHLKPQKLAEVKAVLKKILEII